jgi:hypothetical protein
VSLIDDVVCRQCGCTNLEACAKGCFWVDDDLCSACARVVDADELEDDEDLGDDDNELVDRFYSEDGEW